MAPGLSDFTPTPNPSHHPKKKKNQKKKKKATNTLHPFAHLMRITRFHRHRNVSMKRF